MGTFPGPLVYRPCFDLGRTPSEGLGGPLRLCVTRGSRAARREGLLGLAWVELGYGLSGSLRHPPLVRGRVVAEQAVVAQATAVERLGSSTYA